MMKRNLKLLAAPCAAAALTLSYSMLAFGATGWVDEGGTWYYYDNDGDQVTDSWKKNGDHWFYLNEDGEMATDQIIDSNDALYYVNGDGAMVTNEWRKVDNDDFDYEDNDAEAYWYYFSSNGKAYKASGSSSYFKTFKNADGTSRRYGFDDNGRMLTGWVSESGERVTGDDAWVQGTYYCGGEDDGAQVTNQWMWLEAVDDNNEEPDFEDAYWFYFGSNGKKYTDTTKTINGKKYRFDENGAAENRWYNVASSSTASNGHMYYNEPEQSWLATGWFKAVPSEDLDPEAYNNEDEYWFYGLSNGTLVKSQLKSVNGYKYGFNEKGEMLHGLYKLKFDENRNITDYEEIEFESDIPKADDDEWSVYYFGNSPKEGVMETGKVTVDIDGEKYTYNFKKSGAEKGAGYEGIYDGSIYIEGRLLKADKDAKYEAVPVGSDNYLINTSGKIMKSKTNIKDGDDKYYCTDKDGRITYAEYDKNTK